MGIPEIVRARRLAIAQVIAQGGCPSPTQFTRAELPPLVRASEMVAASAAAASARRELHAERQKRLPGPAF